MCHFTYITAHSPSLPSFYLHHSSFSIPSIILPMSQLILHPFRHFTYATAHSPTLLSLFLLHRLFTYITWRAAHAAKPHNTSESCNELAWVQRRGDSHGSHPRETLPLPFPLTLSLIFRLAMHLHHSLPLLVHLPLLPLHHYLFILIHLPLPCHLPIPFTTLLPLSPPLPLPLHGWKTTK